MLTTQFTDFETLNNQHLSWLLCETEIVNQKHTSTYNLLKRNCQCIYTFVHFCMCTQVHTNISFH